MTRLSMGQQSLVLRRRMALLLDPLSPSRIAKAQTKNKYPMPKLISFDLWGTLFTPKAPVAEQYFAISNGEFGLAKLVEDIAADFAKAFKTLEQKAPNYGKNQGYASTDEWWLEIIAQVYQIPQSDATTEALCRRLIDHFKGPNAYRLYEDVVPVLEHLQAHNVPFVGSSNSDHRVLSIMENLDIMRYFDPGRINLSYDLGHAKPDRQFYRMIAAKYFSGASGDTMTSFLENAWHVGDSYENDFVGAVKSGWNGVLLDRTKSSVFFRGPQGPRHVTNDCFDAPSTEALDSPDLVMVSDNRVCVSGLQQLLTLFRD